MEEARIDHSKYVPFKIKKDKRDDFMAEFKIPGIGEGDVEIMQTYMISIHNTKARAISIARPGLPENNATLPNVASLVFSNSASGYSQPRNVQTNPGHVLSTVVKAVHYYVRKYRPGGVAFVPAHEGLRGPYHVICMEMERSEVLKDPRYFYANPISGKTHGSQYMIQEKYLDFYKQKMSGR